MRILKPDMYARTIGDVDVEKLKEMGIEGMIVDIDNTLVAHNYPDPNEESLNFLKRLEAAGIKVCLVSNNSRGRVESFNKGLGLPFIYRANKPLGCAYKKAVRLMGVKKAHTAAVGDQIFIDVFGGRLAGVYTILVKPIDESGEGMFLKFKRAFEKKIMRGVWENESDKRKT